MFKCPECGLPLAGPAKVCPRCEERKDGETQSQTEETEEEAEEEAEA